MWADTPNWKLAYIYIHYCRNILKGGSATHSHTHTHGTQFLCNMLTAGYFTSSSNPWCCNDLVERTNHVCKYTSV